MKKKVIKDLVELNGVEHKNMYGVIYKGKEYTCNIYYRDDDCGSFQTEIFDAKGNEINKEKLFEEIENFVLENEECEEE